MIEFDVVIQGLSSDERNDFNYDAFREALLAAGFYVEQIQFLR